MTTVITTGLAFLLTVSLTMGDCPYQECVCRNKDIKCQNQGLDKMPPLIAGSVNTYQVLMIQNNRITSIPDKSIPSGLTEIDFGNNPISDIAPSAFNNSGSTLETLSFTNTRLTQIPDAFLSLTKLTSLTIKNSPLQNWNLDVLKHIGASLRELTLNNVGLRSWPAWIANFPSLTDLSLSNSQLTPIPDTAFNMLTSSLKRLTIVSANLTSIPRALTVLSNLVSLDLSNNSITEVENLPSQSKLESLSLGFNNVSDGPKLVNELSPHAASLTYLYLHFNQLLVIPQLDHMTSLLIIHLDNNKISDPASGLLPSKVINLQLSANNFQAIPNVVRQLNKLTSLFISDNSIQEIRLIDLPVQLSHLDIQNNAVKTLQDNTFPANSSLRTLYLSRNPLASISNSAFKNLSGLDTLTLGNTNLTRVPTALSDLASLNTLDLSQNPRLICTCQEAGLVAWFQARPNLNVLGTCGDDSVHDFFTNLATQCRR
ncbi:unnamed protein product [Candidula unifasciata]|uniref:Uncharacterized protein n=1 Tax=Candidula unifasciata TaxID=100452 RepID=A0A8S3YPU3_9EUPU|nr:unnamed protein product [Candidula unifasciata]